ncbi:MAG: TRAP transporter substrate-binding protein DctP [Alphaproteobacteria bacterium]|nr:TRAP transporter substrate-binding protein DctP [Alphaproteobacteria bacterium]MBU1551370.1 TRAP transporter substrate-binding protein DctP [Alphaproteobacteria bacterium]MBU2336531.1 TRAP transporter substrate-binding protein DctP [Alphaproteobacteria bacterium]MBU2387945.1 TRAP transporter substrate-binding protein DctP [Alphaproteobacteria bacterium]
MTKMNLSRRSLLQLTAAGFAAAGATRLATPAIAQNAKVSWRMQSLWDGGTTPQKYEELFVQKVAEKTGGGFELKLFSAGQIVPPAQSFDAVRGGAFQLMKTFDGYTAGKIAAHAFTSTIPFGYKKSEDYGAWFYELGGLDMARESYAPAGLHYIAPTIYDQEPIHSTVEIRTIADLSGKKGRFTGLGSTVMGAFGVAVTPLPTAEVYSALDKGLIDIADRGDLQANLDAGLAEVAKFIILPGVHQPTTATSYVANTAAFDALPDDFKAALADAAKEISDEYQANKTKTDATALAAFKESGVTVIELDEADVTASRSKAVEAWRTAAKSDPLANKILDSQIAQMKELGLLT